MTTMMLLAFNRYFRVVQPALYANIFSKKRSVAMAVCAWIKAIAIVVVLSLATGKQPQKLPVEPLTTKCVQLPPGTDSSKLFYNYIIPIIHIVVSGLTIVACYIKIYQTIRQHNTAAAQSSQGGQSSYGVEEAKITRMLTVVVVAFYLCWLPPFIGSILLALDLLEETAIKYWNFYFTFPIFTSSVINPMVYATMSQSFRNEFMKILRRHPSYCS